MLGTRHACTFTIRTNPEPRLAKAYSELTMSCHTDRMEHVIELRRSDRNAVVLPAGCRTSSGMRYVGEISDISSEGCCFTTNVPLFRVGTRVIVRPEGLEGLTGVVRWIKGTKAGIEFDSPIYGPVLGHLVDHCKPSR